MRITLITDPDLVNTNYRAYQPMHILSAQGHEIRDNKSRYKRIDQSVLKSDAVLIHRFVDDEVLHWVRLLHDAGVGVMWDNDDDILAIPRSNPLYRQYGGRRAASHLGRLRTMMELADIVSTPSRALAERFRELGGRDVRVLPNFVRNDFVCAARPSRHGVLVGWLAGLEHQLDFQQLRLQDVFLRLLELHPDLRFTSIGFGLGLPRERYEYLPQADFLHLPQLLSRFDIGIAPIADTAFNRARSNVKLKEYSAAGVPWLASAAGPYVGVSEREGGRLVADDEWETAISALVTDSRRRRKLAKRAAKWGRTQTIGRNAHLWETALTEAAARARARVGDRTLPSLSPLPG